MTYCDRTKIKCKVNELLNACRFGYCVCYPDAQIQYCYECDDFTYEEVGDER